MNPHNVAPRLGQAPAGLGAMAPDAPPAPPAGLRTGPQGDRFHRGRIVRALPARLHPGMADRTPLIAPSLATARELSMRLRSLPPRGQ